jgi:hypothetical protein
MFTCFASEEGCAENLGFLCFHSKDRATTLVIARLYRSTGEWLKDEGKAKLVFAIATMSRTGMRVLAKPIGLNTS